MNEEYQDWEGRAPSRRRAGGALILLAVLGLVSLAAWLAWHSVRGSGADDKAGAVQPAPALTPGPSDQKSSLDRKSPSDAEAPSGPKAPSDGKKPSGRQGPPDQEDGPHQKDRPGQEGGGKQQLPLRGKTVVIDPGHNPHNSGHFEEISRRVDIGTGEKECDTAGTSTDSGYAEAQFTLDLARRVRTELARQGAKVELTHEGRAPYGPCVDERARIGNDSDADAAVSLHADGAPEGNRGFHVIVPESVREGKADTSRIATPSRRLGRELRDAFRDSTDEPTADYLGDGKGLDTRGDLGGLNLSSIPKVFLECGNMRNQQDADLLTDPAWRARAAHGVTEGIAAYLTRKR